MSCSFCGSDDRDGRRIAQGPGEIAICEDCVTERVDFFGAIAKMPFGDRPATVQPRSAWDKRSAPAPTLFERRRS